MPKAKKEAEPTVVQPGSIDELTHIMALLMKYQGVPQRVLVHDLSKAGLTPTRIAALILTTPNTVSQEKRQKRPDWPPKRRVPGDGSD